MVRRLPYSKALHPSVIGKDIWEALLRIEMNIVRAMRES